MDCVRILIWCLTLHKMYRSTCNNHRHVSYLGHEMMPSVAHWKEHTRKQLHREEVAVAEPPRRYKAVALHLTLVEFSYANARGGAKHTSTVIRCFGCQHTTAEPRRAQGQKTRPKREKHTTNTPRTTSEITTRMKHLFTFRQERAFFLACESQLRFGADSYFPLFEHHRD